MPGIDTDLGGDSYLYNVSVIEEQVDGKKWMTITFTRPLQVTDSYDITIADQQYHMLWAVGPDGTVNYAAKTYSQHSSQGDVLVNFFSNNALCEAATNALNPYFKAHGILMIVVWTMMLFVGTYIARYMKPVTDLWFKVHVALQTIGCFAVVAAFVVIFSLLRWQLHSGLASNDRSRCDCWNCCAAHHRSYCRQDVQPFTSQGPCLA